MSPYDRAHMISYSSLIETMHLSCTVSEIQWVICRNSPTSTIPHLHLSPLLGVTSFEFRKDFWHQKTRVPGPSCGVVCVFLCLAILVEHRLVTDTDRQTHDHGIYRAEHSSHGKTSCNYHHSISLRPLITWSNSTNSQTALASQIMQLPLTIRLSCLSVCFHFVFWADSPLTLMFCR